MSSCSQAVLSVQVDGDSLDTEQVGDLLHRDVQRRLYRQLRHGLPAEGEKRLRPPQLLN
jgi:hypothetical protein